MGNVTVFNKAIVIGIDGTLLAVHHKHHLAHALIPKENRSVRREGVVFNPSALGVYNDDLCGAWPVPDATVFTAHFGVSFGIIICHETNFASPLRSILQRGVRDMIFPTWRLDRCATSLGLDVCVYMDVYPHNIHSLSLIIYYIYS